jgi:hypothetical protein
MQLDAQVNVTRLAEPSIKGRPLQLPQRGERLSMTDRSQENPQDLRNLLRVVSACRPLGICSRFVDRGLSVFVIEGLPVRSKFFGARDTGPLAAALR